MLIHTDNTLRGIRRGILINYTDQYWSYKYSTANAKDILLSDVLKVFTYRLQAERTGFRVSIEGEK